MQEQDPLLAALNEAAKIDEDRLWHTGSMANITVRLKDGSYKRNALAAGDPPMFFRGVRPGKRADYVFEFEPVDVRPFEMIEFTEKDVFAMLPGFEEFIVTSLGYPKITKVDVSGNLKKEEQLSFSQARGRFRKDHQRREEEKQAAVIAAAKTSDADRYKNNPLWGAF